MYESISFRAGEENVLAEEFIKLTELKQIEFNSTKIEKVYDLKEEDILAVHFADAGAQGCPGIVEILYQFPEGIRILCGNYAYGNLNLDDIMQKLPMLRYLDTRYGSIPPYPFGGKLEIPSGWGYLYMGAMNHFFARSVICEKTGYFVSALGQEGYRGFVFDAIAWFCGVPSSIPL